MTIKSGKRRIYTEDFKQDAVALVTEQGYKVSEAARSLDINSNQLHRWKQRFTGKRRARAESRQSLGSRRMSRALRKKGFDVGRDRARRLMKSLGLVVKRKRKYKSTPDSKHGHPVAEYVLKRDFSPAVPNQA